MASLASPMFGFSYSGTTSCSRDWTISHIDIEFNIPSSFTVSTKLEESSDSRAVQHPPFFVKPHTGNQALDKKNIKKADTIGIPTILANAINLSARIFKRNEDVTRRAAIPLKDLPVFKEENYYWISITQKAANTEDFQGEITEIGRSELFRRIKFARLYPNSMLYSPQEKTELTPDKEVIYSDYEAMVYGMVGWVKRFAKTVKLSLPKNDSFYEDLAREAIRKQVVRMSDDTLKSLLDLKKEGEACQEDPSLLSSFIERYQNALAKAMGYDGYASILLEVLKTVAADPSHKETIQKTVAEFAAFSTRHLDNAT